MPEIIIEPEAAHPTGQVGGEVREDAPTQKVAPHDPESTTRDTEVYEPVFLDDADVTPLDDNDEPMQLPPGSWNEGILAGAGGSWEGDTSAPRPTQVSGEVEVLSVTTSATDPGDTVPAAAGAPPPPPPPDAGDRGRLVVFEQQQQDDDDDGVVFEFVIGDDDDETPGDATVRAGADTDEVRPLPRPGVPAPPPEAPQPPPRPASLFTRPSAGRVFPRAPRGASTPAQYTAPRSTQGVTPVGTRRRESRPIRVTAGYGQVPPVPRSGRPAQGPHAARDLDRRPPATGAIPPPPHDPAPSGEKEGPLFGADLVTERTLDEVILSCLDRQDDDT